MSTMRARRPLAAVVVVLLSLVGLAACGKESDNTKAGTTTVEATDDFPITLDNAFGETVIEKEPQRVATWGWGSTEAAIASGVFPVAIAEQVWTVGEGNLLPWVEEAYDEAGVEHPALLPDDGSGATVPYDDFIAARPDLILAPYSGISKKQYDELSEIAPVVAYPEAAWTTPWDQTIELTAQALGRSDQGDKILTGIDDYLAAEAKKHPEFKGVSLAALYPGGSKLSVYTERDPRLAVMTKLGFTIAPGVDELDTSDGGFYYDMSWEKVDQIDADVVITYHDTDKQAAAFLDDEKAQAVPAVKAGKVAQVVGRPNISAVSPPTALSFEWADGLPDVIAKLAAALKNNQG